MSPTSSRSSNARRAVSFLKANLNSLRKDPRGFTKQFTPRSMPASSSMKRKTATQKEYAKLFEMTLRDWLTWHHAKTRFDTMHWMGVPMIKNPLDAWVFSEILHEVKPDRVVEIGRGAGGTTLYIADLLQLMGKGTVISIDIKRNPLTHKHKRIIEVVGDSHSPSILRKVAKLCREKSVLVIQDGDHNKDAVLKDLRTYSKLVTVNSYFIVEDGILDLFDRNSVIGRSGGVDEGPLAAVESFLKEDSNFMVDRRWERYIMTYNPRGYLRKVR